ncbi:type II toxin-antitoxin system RelE/ParE family toxin [Pseudomonas sp. GD03944]|uniref:type II toxin-antitoxin system RelE/ParE family toxin n=1 Tax=Pseudomonas sp. GD03944 TaxID=2975409 RepID=UPI00244A8843|nr:type II toxin-antitoxin system RelE/ParE family toxin [Pseudomonas sp. GD03944]MDH1264879.1 type II toxin-antitoxin system RelE/ParE family toxin [Pseudomonas sp. GD03944]
MRLIYSAEAVADLARLRAFIARNDPRAASRVATDLIARLEHLCLFPDMGRPVQSAPDPASIRDTVVGKYIIRYSVHPETVVILRLWHHYEDRTPSI